MARQIFNNHLVNTITIIDQLKEDEKTQQRRRNKFIGYLFLRVKWTMRLIGEYLFWFYCYIDNYTFNLVLLD